MKIAVLTGCLDSFMPLGKHTIYENKVEYCKRHGYHLEIIRSIRNRYQDPKSHAGGFSWSRLEHLLEMVGSGCHDFIWIVGGDTLVTNMAIRLESIIQTAMTVEAIAAPLPEPSIPENSPAPPAVLTLKADASWPTRGIKHVLICGERFSTMQADSFIVKASPETAAWLKEILSLYPVYKTECWVEQQAMIDLREKYGSIIHTVPQWQLNSVDYSRWHSLRPEYKDGTDCYGNRGDWQSGDLIIHWPAATLEERLEMLKKYEPQIVR